METIKKKKLLIVIVATLVVILYLSHWLGCRLDSKFFFSALDVKLRIIFDIRSDQYVRAWEARMLHNKITQGSVDVFNAYIQFWDVRFLFFFLSPLGVLGLISWTYYAIKKQRVEQFYEKIFLALSFLIPFVILFGFITNAVLMILLLAVPLLVLGFRGLFLLIANNKYYVYYFSLALIFSLWYLLILNTMIINFCHQ